MQGAIQGGLLILNTVIFLTLIQVAFFFCIVLELTVVADLISHDLRHMDVSLDEAVVAHMDHFSPLAAMCTPGGYKWKLVERSYGYSNDIATYLVGACDYALSEIGAAPVFGGGLAEVSTEILISYEFTVSEGGV